MEKGAVEMSEPNYLLFPHTVLSEKELRHLAILLPRLEVLHICRQLAMPDWAHGILQARPVISEEEATQTDLLLKEYRNFASLVGDSSVLTSMSHFSHEDIWRESRFRIQSHLKGKDQHKRMDGSLLAALEASVFMEMAGDLDQQGMELQRGVAQVENLEREFLDILGISGEENKEEDALEVGDWRLSSDDNYMNFLLEKRLEFWLRLYLRSAQEEVPVLVTVTSEVLAEIVDPLVDIGHHSKDPATVIFRSTLPPMSEFSRLNNEAFAKILVNLRNSDVLRTYWQSVGRVIDNPKDPGCIEEIEKSSDQLKNILAEYGAEEDAGGQPQSRLSIITCPDLTIGDLWKRLDKSSSELMISSPILDKRVIVVLYEKDFIQ